MSTATPHEDWEAYVEMMDAKQLSAADVSFVIADEYGITLYSTCPDCDGEGTREEPHPFPDDPYHCRVFACRLCGGSGLVQVD